jgi:hypothetical protein
VEACLTLDANRWMREGILTPRSCLTGAWRWTYGNGRECSVAYEANTLCQCRPFVRLWYSWSQPATQEEGSEDYRVSLTTTAPWFGGQRWWFVCPLVIDGRPCERRVGRLYLPPGGRYFGCRHCHRLTYRSAQEHDKRVDAMRRNPALLDAAVNGPTNVTLLGLAWQALEQERRQREKRERRHANVRDRSPAERSPRLHSLPSYSPDGTAAPDRRRDRTAI